MESKYVVQVKLAGDAPWMTILGDGFEYFKFYTLACVAMIQAKAKYPDYEFRVEVTV